jgi:hypothetical protein
MVQMPERFTMPGVRDRPLPVALVQPANVPCFAFAVSDDDAKAIRELTVKTVADVVDPRDLALDPTFGPSATHMAYGGLMLSVSNAVARWASGAYHLAALIGDARRLDQWHAGRSERAANRQAALTGYYTRIAQSQASKWGGSDLIKDVADLIQKDDPKPSADGAARAAWQDARQLEGQLHALVVGGGVASQMAVGVAATCDPKGWGHTRAAIADALPSLDIDTVARTAIAALSGPRLGARHARVALDHALRNLTRHPLLG